jgi:hypothetical protein
MDGTDHLDDASIVEELVIGRRHPRRHAGPRSWAAVLVVAALAATGVWYFGRSDHHKLVVTYAGNTVDNATEALSRADAAFVSFTRARYGARSAGAGCYFDRIGGQARTDVSPNLYCGPVLFYGGAAPALYLRYAMQPSGAAGHGHTTLNVAPQPVSATPERLPTEARLERPDGRTAPKGTAGLVAPPPPPTSFGALVRVRATDIPSLPRAAATSIIGTRDLQITLKASGVIPYYGHGVRARSAQRGEKLLAFRLDIEQGDVTGEDSVDPISLGLAVDGGPPRPLPFSIDVFDIQYSAAITRYVVAAVPAHARSVDLVAADAGITQRMSLPDGTLGRGNIAVLARDGADRFGTASAARTALARIEANGTRFTGPLDMEVSTPYLGYYSQYGPQHAAGIDRALLNLPIYYKPAELACPGSSCGALFGAQNLTLVPTGGRPIRARDLGGGVTVFDVPASFRTGVVTVAGSAKEPGAWTVALLHPYRVKISFPG